MVNYDTLQIFGHTILPNTVGDGIAGLDLGVAARKPEPLGRAVRISANCRHRRIAFLEI